MLRVFGIGWEAAAKAEGADDTASGGAGVRARSLVPGPAARFGAGADDVSSVHVHSSPHLNMKSLEEQEASRDLRALGRMSSLAANAAAGTAATVGAASARRGAAAGKRAVAAVLPAAAVEEGVAPGGSFRAAGNAGRMVSELAGASGPAAMNGDVHKLAEALCRPLQEQLQQVGAVRSCGLSGRKVGVMVSSSGASGSSQLSPVAATDVPYCVECFPPRATPLWRADSGCSELAAGCPGHGAGAAAGGDGGTAGSHG